MGRALSKSATTANVILAEKTYPYVSCNNNPYVTSGSVSTGTNCSHNPFYGVQTTNSRKHYVKSTSPPPSTKYKYNKNPYALLNNNNKSSNPFVCSTASGGVLLTSREKTPYRIDNNRRKSNHPAEPPYTYLGQDDVYRVRHRSNHSELRPRRSAKPLRAGKSEVSDRSSLKLVSLDIPSINDDLLVPVHRHNRRLLDDETTPTNNIDNLNNNNNNKNESNKNVADAAPGSTDEVVTGLSDREAKRKEIQSLIMKYSALDEVYNRGAAKSGLGGEVAAAPPAKQISAATAIAQKYYPMTSRLVSVGVSREARPLRVRLS